MTMSLSRTGAAEHSPRFTTHPRFGRIPAPGHDRFAQPLGDSAFVALRAAYRSTGGVARGDEIAAWANLKGQGDYLSLNRAIVAGELFSFAWNNAFWLPMFQFDLHDLSVRPEVRWVLADLGKAFDGWELAVWFAEPNAWLQGRRPVDLLETAFPEVVLAAQADLYIATC